MDMLFQRYANPMAMMNGMIKTRRFTEFVDEFLKLYTEDMKEKVLWELWLHRIFDKSYPEFVRSQDDKTAAPPTQEDTIGIVKESLAILNGFAPESEKVGKDGDIPAAGDGSG